MSWSRRRFLRDVAVASGAIAVGGVGALQMPSIAARRGPGVGAHQLSKLGGVLSFHLDQPYVDLTGEATAFRPPVGARGGESIAALSDVELSRYYGVI
jgi:hypothetical protein